MKKSMLTLFSAAMATGAAVFAADPAPAYPLYRDALTFHIGFDGTTDAALSKGLAKPIKTYGKPAFQPGVRGKAVMCGKDGAMMLYMRNKNIDLTKPGTICFFYKAQGWENAKLKGGVFFCGIQAKNGALYFNLAHDPATACPCRRPVTLHFFNGKKIPAQLYANYPQFPKSACEEWHMLAFSWEPGKLQISWDGKAWKEFPVAFTITAADFPNPAFCIGANSRWNYLMDEFTAYNRVLTGKELAEIYKAVKK